MEVQSSLNKEKIAILVDSCCNVPQEFVDKYGMYVIPLKVLYKDREYMDGVDITAEEVYRGLEKEIPKTSLPSGEHIQKILDRIKADGYEKVIAVTISSGLSGTNNMINLLAKIMKDWSSLCWIQKIFPSDQDFMPFKQLVI